MLPLTHFYLQRTVFLYLPIRPIGNHFVFILKYSQAFPPNAQVSGGQNNSDLNLHLISQLSVHLLAVSKREKKLTVSFRKE